MAEYLPKETSYPIYSFTMDYGHFLYLFPLARSLVCWSLLRKFEFEDYAIKFSIRLNREFNGYNSEQVKFFSLSGTHCDDFSPFKRLCFSSLFLTTIETIEFIREHRIVSFSLVHRKAIKHIWLCAVDVKGFADETNKITKQLIFQNHQQTVRDFTCSPLNRIFFFSFSLFIITCFLSSLLFVSLAHFYSESTLHGVSNTNECTASKSERLKRQRWRWRQKLQRQNE